MISTTAKTCFRQLEPPRAALEQPPVLKIVPDIKDDGLSGVRENRGEIVRVLLVPAEPHQRGKVMRLVDNCRVLK